ncbi:flippase [Photobacterium sp. NCIMB 13483]|uniref:oligosaccharide flippase family protein n=1 Tax=Photobacterium sp. NCIMB 13483 TaxID=2022103 RepID=UPI000D155249|nr:oligosaccharide flippase family protein [Photobacterium sp. NCIMB 13483]PST93545.1 flippase [Photobacterium sp. NCIMB 13483]
MLKSMISLLFVQGSNYLIPLLTLPYLSRVLGVEGFGKYGLTLSTIQYFVMITDFGFNLSATKKIADVQNDKVKVSIIFYETMIAKIAICLASILTIVVLVSINMDNVFSSTLYYSIIMLVGTVLLPMWFFQGIEKIPVLSFLMVMTKLVSLPFFFIFVKDSSDIGIAIFIQSSTNFIVGLFAIFYIIKNKLLVNVKYKDLSVYKSIHEASPIFLASFAISLYTMSTTIIISLSSNITEVGLFSAADRLKGAVLGVFFIMGNVIYPRVNKLLATNKNEAYRIIRTTFIIQGILSIAIIIFIYLFNREIVSVFYSEEYKKAGVVLIVLSFTILLAIEATVLGNYILLPHGYNKEYTILPMVIAAIHIPLCFFLSHKYGAIGGASSIVIGEFLSFIILLFVVIRKNLFRKIFIRGECV